MGRSRRSVVVRDIRLDGLQPLQQAVTTGVVADCFGVVMTEQEWVALSPRIYPEQCLRESWF